MPKKSKSLWEQIKDSLKNKFSIKQFMFVTGLDQKDKREARNILSQFVLSGHIRRVTQNVYEKLSIQMGKEYSLHFLLI